MLDVGRSHYDETQLQPDHPRRRGQTIQRWSIFADRGCISSGAPASRHAHASATISFVLKGSCTEIVGKATHECSLYAPILKPPGEAHSNQYGRTGAKCMLIEIKPEGLEMIRTFSRVLDRVSHVQEAPFYGLAMRIHREFEIMDSAAALSIEGLVL